jgi:hypothetical protein
VFPKDLQELLKDVPKCPKKVMIDEGYRTWINGTERQLAEQQEKEIKEAQKSGLIAKYFTLTLCRSGISQSIRRDCQ